MAKKILKICLIVLGSIVGLVALILLGAHLLTPVIYSDFFLNSEEAYVGTGLDSKFVQQGYAYDEKNEVFLHSGYMADDSASRIYIVPENDTSNTRYVNLIDKDGAPYTGHVGGVATDGVFVWIINGGETNDTNRVWTVLADDILNAQSGDNITLEIFFNPESNGSFGYYDGKYLWVGEFNDFENYTTTHSFELPDGSSSNAIACAYKVNRGSIFGLNINAPEKILSITNKVQGFTRDDDGNFYVSTSYGFTSSHLISYKDVMLDPPDTSMKVNGVEVPVWHLDNEAMIKDLKMQPMSEGIYEKDGKIYVTFESASQKYIFGHFTRGIYVYSYSLQK